MGEKVGFTNCVFEKLCFFFWKHYFYSVFSQTQLFKNQNCMLKNRKFMKNSGLFLNMAKWCFWGLFFCRFSCYCGLFLVCGIVPKVLKMLVFFPNFFWAFMGWLILVYLGLEGLGVFVFLVFVLVFCVAFVSVLFALFLFVAGLFWVLVIVLLFCCFFCFFGGFKGQLALNPPYFLFVFFCLFSLPSFLCFFY